MCRNFYGDVIYCEICRFTENTKIKISWERNIIFHSNKKIHSLYIKRYTIAMLALNPLLFLSIDQIIFILTENLGRK